MARNIEIGFFSGTGSFCVKLGNILRVSFPNRNGKHQARDYQGRRYSDYFWLTIFGRRIFPKHIRYRNGTEGAGFASNRKVKK